VPLWVPLLLALASGLVLEALASVLQSVAGKHNYGPHFSH
jgi:hypothetical protein